MERKERETGVYLFRNPCRFESVGITRDRLLYIRWHIVHIPLLLPLLPFGRLRYDGRVGLILNEPCAHLLALDPLRRFIVVDRNDLVKEIF